MIGSATAKMKVPICWLVVALLSLSAAGQKPSNGTAARVEHARVQDVVFRSASLGRVMHYRLLFPARYAAGGNFPVLYLLHGLYGDYKNWDTLTRLERYAKSLRLIVVMPDADNSWYTNSATAPADRFEDYIVKDLVAEIDGKLRTIRDRRGRAIAGLSMGGYAAIKFGLKYPRMFAFAGSLSGALNAAQNLDTLRPEFSAKLLQVFANPGSATRTQNDVFTLITLPHNVPYPYFYLACGTADFFLQTNRDFAGQLSSRKLPYEYHETPGEHSWEYWDRELPALLGSMERTLGEQGGNSPLHAPATKP